MSHQGPGRHRPQPGDRESVPWPGHQPDVFDYPVPGSQSGRGGWDGQSGGTGWDGQSGETGWEGQSGETGWEGQRGWEGQGGSGDLRGASGASDGGGDGIGYSELTAYRRAGYPGHPGRADYQGTQDYPVSQEYQAPTGYRTSAVITEPGPPWDAPGAPSWEEPGWGQPGGPGWAEPGGTGWTEPNGPAWEQPVPPDSDEFAAPVIDPAPIGTPPGGFPTGGPAAGGPAAGGPATSAPPATDGDQDPAAYAGMAPPGPGSGPIPGAWRARGRGLLAALTAGLLAAAVAVTVGELAARLLRPQAAPVSAVAAMLRSGSLARLAGQSAGTHGHSLFLPAWLFVAVVAAVLGLVARRRRAAGVIGVAAVFGVAAAFVVLTRPGSHAGDVIPALLGGAAGAAAMAGLEGAAAPRVVLARALTRVRGGWALTGDLDVVGTNRRRFLLATLSATAVTVVAGGATKLLTPKVKVIPPLKPGPVQQLPPLAAADKLDSIAGISPFYTPNDRFYRVDTAVVVPKVTTQQWKLRIHGMVDKPIEIDFEELMSRPQIQRDITIVCVSESVGGGYIGNARWQGTRLADLLREAGVHAGATQIVMRDVQGMAVGVSTQAVMDGRDALLATRMNGQPLPAEHGYPVRVVVPGLYGYVSACKWVVDMELTTYAAYDAYWVKRAWSAQATVKTESRIDTPKAGKPLQAGQVVIAGVAWAQRKGIAKVEVGIDGEWAEATLAAQDTIDTWRQWYFRWDAIPGTHVLQVRATDQTGYTQTETVHGPPPNGATGYHTVKVTVA